MDVLNCRMCCSRNEQARLAIPAADATLATRDLLGSDLPMDVTALRRDDTAARLAIPARGYRRPTAGLA
jgi:hypothetical protein